MAYDIEFLVGAKVLKAQKKTLVKPLFYPKPYEVIMVDGPQITAEREGRDSSEERWGFEHSEGILVSKPN